MMAEGRERIEWGRLSAWMALFANANRDPKKTPQPFAPREFDPFAPKTPRPKLSKTDSVKALSALFGARKEQ